MAIAKALTAAPNLTSINLSANLIGAAGAEAIAKALEFHKIQILEGVKWDMLAPEQQTKEFKNFIFKFAPKVKQYIADGHITLGKIYDSFKTNPQMSDDCALVEYELLKISCEDQNPEIINKKMLEIALHHQRFAKDIMTNFLDAAQFNEVQIILTSLQKHAASKLFQGFMEEFALIPCPEKGAENEGYYKSLLSQILHIYNTQEQRFESLTLFTKQCNLYAVGEAYTLTLSEHPTFRTEHLTHLIESIPEHFKESKALHEMYKPQLSGAEDLSEMLVE